MSSVKLPFFSSITSSFLSGLTIVFGTVVFLSCPDRIVGSALFSFALMTIICRGLLLYTGKIGYVRTFGVKNILVTLLGNLIGTFVGGVLISFTRIKGTLLMEGVQQKAQTLVNVKLSDNLLSVFILACCCGVMMFLAVDNYAKSKSWLFVVLPIMVFILCGFEHCIANAAYITLAGAWSLQAALYLGVMITGNAVGSWIYLLQPEKE